MIFAEIGQLLIALGFSTATAFWLGPSAYLVVALFVFVVVGILLFDNARRQLDSLPTNSVFALAVSVVMTACVFGAIWPSLPPILGYTAIRKRRASGGDRSEP